MHQPIFSYKKNTASIVSLFFLPGLGMRSFLLLFLCLLTSINAEIHTLSLSNLGCVRYLVEEDQIRQIQRFSKTDELMYSCKYEYDHSGIPVYEWIENESGEIIYSSKFDFLNDQVPVALPGRNLRKEYDEAGNLICLEGKKFSYDDNHRLIRVSDENSVIEYEYNPSGNRISRTVNGNTEYFVFQGINEVARIDGDGSVFELRIPGITPHKDILRPATIETPNAIYIPKQNIQGTITSLIDMATLEELPLSLADPYGQGLDQSSPVSWIFSGKYYDKEAGLVYFGARHYSPEIGEWLTPDPMQQSPDPYLYCLGDPVNYIDPDGQFAIAAPIITFAWGAGAAVTAPFWAPCAAVVAGATIGYLGYKSYANWKDGQEDSFSNLMERRKKGGIDPTLPKNPDKDKNWEDISHPDAKRNGHHKYKNKKTGEEIAFDKAKPERFGHDAHDHYHRMNPKKTGDSDIYLDQSGNPVSKGSEASHLYPPEWVWWQ